MTETHNYKMLPIQGNKTSKMIGDEVRVFQTHEGEFFLTCELRLKDERTLQRFGSTTFLAQETK